ncbi:hypothetical protein BJF90_15020 [Pseudonocardia sp. CNS-004]|nr:hypothetical protein BJF90_15020 [Pseudonocardia sp. CNS-004]
MGGLTALERGNAQRSREVGQPGSGARRVLGRDPPGDAARAVPAVGQLQRDLGLPAPGSPTRATARGLRASSSRTSPTRVSTSSRPTNERLRGGRPAGSTDEPVVGSGSWASTAACTRRSSGAGSTPSCSASAWRHRSYAASASA